jgi:hypothetical protein
MGQIQPQRDVKKGEGAWVTETLTDPTNGKVLRVNAYTEEQIDMFLANTQKKFEADLKMLTEMKDLLKA